MNKNYVPKPDWLKIRLANTNCYGITGNILHANRLNTICESGKCPNQGECWSKGTATFMICGDICTRACKFCNTKTGHPLPIDVDEPERLWKSIKLMGLKYVVLTSVDRDDLPDLGVEQIGRAHV